MTPPDPVLECPDCGEPVTFAFLDTSGVGAHKRGEHFNTTPDTRHYVCWPCATAWKQRLTGPLTPDVVGQLALFTCSQADCGRALAVEESSPLVLACPVGHRFTVANEGDAGLRLAPAI